MLLIYPRLFDICDIVKNILNEKHILRGGIAFGNVFYDRNNNIIFGPAVAEAYKLESDKAKVPRILIQNVFAEKLLEYEKYNNLKLSKQKEVEEKKLKNLGIEIELPENSKVIFKDKDGEYVLNYLNDLNVAIAMVSRKVFNIKNAIYMCYSYMEKEYDEDICILKKYVYIYEYSFYT